MNKDSETCRTPSDEPIDTCLIGVQEAQERGKETERTLK